MNIVIGFSFYVLVGDRYLAGREEHPVPTNGLERRQNIDQNDLNGLHNQR